MYDTLLLNLFFNAFITMHSDVDPEMSIHSCAKYNEHVYFYHTFGNELYPK